MAQRTCHECGSEFMPSHGNTRYCGDACREAVNARRVQRQVAAKIAENAAQRADDIRECPHCGDLFTPRYNVRQVYCSRRCVARALAERETRTCSVEGCGRKLRARGLCGSHYNQTYQTNRHAKVEVPCAACGKPVLKFKSGERRPVCSYRCRHFVRTGQWPIGSRPKRRKWEIVGPLPKVRTTEAPLNVLPSTRRGFLAGLCAWCDAPFVFDLRVTGSLPSYCSVACRKRAADARRGKKFQPKPRKRRRIYERDGYICQICHEPTEPDTDVMHPWHPTLDHIVPRSQGGSDDDDNLRTAHRWCNSARGDLSYYTDDDFAA